MSTHKPFLRRPLFWILSVPAAIIIVLAVWFLLPLDYEVDVATSPDSVVGYLVSNLHRDRGVGGLARSYGAERFAGPDAGFLRRTAFRVGSSVGFPRSVSGWIIEEPGSTLPAVVAIVELGRVVRLLRLVHPVVLPRALFGSPGLRGRVGPYRLHAAPGGAGTTPVAAYTFVGDSLLVSTSREVLFQVLQFLADGARAQSAEAMAIQALRPTDAHIYLTNRRGGLTGLVQAVEERVAFAALPSVDAIHAIHITADVEGTVDAARVAGSLAFEYSDPERAGDVYSDVRFLYGTLRRMARSQEIEFQGEITETTTDITLRYSAMGLERLLAPTEQPPESSADQGPE